MPPYPRSASPLTLPEIAHLAEWLAGEENPTDEHVQILRALCQLDDITRLSELPGHEMIREYSAVKLRLRFYASTLESLTGYGIDGDPYERIAEMKEIAGNALSVTPPAAPA